MVIEGKIRIICDIQNQLYIYSTVKRRNCHETIYRSNTYLLYTLYIFEVTSWHKIYVNGRTK